MYQTSQPSEKLFLRLDGTDLAYFAVKLRGHIQNQDFRAFENHSKLLKERHGEENYRLILSKYTEMFEEDPPAAIDFTKPVPQLSAVSIGSSQDYRLAAALLKELRRNELWQEVSDLKSELAKENIFGRQELVKL